MSSLQRITLEKRLPSKVKAPVVGLSRQSGLKVPWGPHTSFLPNYTWGTPGINNCGGHSVGFPLETQGTSSLLTEAPGPLSSRSTTIMGLSGQAKGCNFSHPLSCNWEFVKFSHKFLIMPESFSLLVGRDILKKVQASVFTNMEPILFNWTNCKS